jgi:hypothetical protein
MALLIQPKPACPCAVTARRMRCWSRERTAWVVGRMMMWVIWMTTSTNWMQVHTSWGFARKWDRALLGCT